MTATSIRFRNLSFVLLIVTVTGSPARSVSRLAVGETPAGVWHRTLAAVAGLPSGATAVAAAVADFDADGIADLASVHRTDEGGVVVLRRADPQSRESAGDRSAGPFLSAAAVARLDEAPDFVVAGDVDNDGLADLVVGSRAATTLTVLLGDGHGSFPERARLDLGAVPTALAAADVDRPDGIVDLIVGVSGPEGASGPSGPALVVFESPQGAVHAVAEKIALPAPVTSIVADHLLGTSWTDVAAACGEEIVLVAGRDRRLHTPGAEAEPLTVTRLPMRATIESFAAGRLLDDGANRVDLAALTTDGAFLVPDLRRAATDEGRALDQEGSAVESTTILRASLQVAPPGAGAMLLPAAVQTVDGARLALVDPQQQRVRPLRLEASGSVSEEVSQVVTGGGIVVPMRLDADGLDDLVALDGSGGGGSVTTTALVTIYTVDSTGDATDASPGNNVCADGAGACTLRAAIMEANAHAGADSISFALGAGTPTIAPATALPSITQPVTVMGNTGGATRIQINGAATPADSNGLTLAAGSSGSLVRSLVVNRFTGTGVGIRIESATNTVEDCWIGLDSVGSISVAGNAGGGVRITGASATGNLIGGAAAARNVVSHNGGTGILIDAGASTNKVQGNYVGTNPGATTAFANGADGVAIAGGSTNNEVGTSTATPGSAPGNVISGNTDDGVDISGSGSTGNLVQGNLIGTNGAGASTLGNGQNGVIVQGSAASNAIGGTASGHRNVISGNTAATGDGIELNGPGVTGTNVFGNTIGLDVTGASALSNGEDGVCVLNGPTTTTIGAATATPGTTGGNVISGNVRQGIRFEGSPTSGGLVQGNLIGTNAAGTAARRNLTGIHVVGVPNITVGGTSAAQRNVISGNEAYAIQDFGNGGNNLTVQGNYIGTNAAGSSAIPNFQGGVVMTNALGAGLTGLLVGGATTPPGAPPGNVISGNTGVGGINVEGPLVGATIRGNIIGLNASGTAAIGNNTGIALTFGSSNNLIGGTTPSVRNIISGNTIGVASLNTGNPPTTNLVQGNYIGTDITGTLAVGNVNGISITGVPGTVIGSSTPTPGTGAGNVISGNTMWGISVVGQGSSGIVKGNLIGTTSTGMAPLPNRVAGIDVGQRASLTVGGSSAGDRNVISGNSFSSATVGIACSLCSASTIVTGNWIGPDITGAGTLPNSIGVSYGTGASPGSSMVLGGTSPGSGNVISGNLAEGVRHSDSNGGSGQLLGNLIGVAPDGTSAMGNGSHGVNVLGTSTLTVGGTTGLTAGACTGSCNTIRFNGGNGISRLGNSTKIIVRGNRISDNAGLGIDLKTAGPTPNDAPDLVPQNFPAITFLSYDSGANTSTIQGTLISTGSTTLTIDVFRSPSADPSGFGEGNTWLGAATCATDTVGNGFWSLSVPGNPSNVTATATGPSNGTSEFSPIFVDCDADGYGDTVDNCACVSNPAQIDADFDGHGDACDCAPGDASAFALSEVSGFSIAPDTQTLYWANQATSMGPGTVIDVVRGLVPDLPVDGGPSESCLGSTGGDTMTDATTPPLGGGLWYVVRARNACGIGTYGSASSGAPRTSNACP